jgi:hypothetical protein
MRSEGTTWKERDVDGDQWWAFVSTVTNVRGPAKETKSLEELSD